MGIKSTLQKFRGKRSSEMAVYDATPVIRDGQKIATLYRLSCPLCGRHIKRFENFCGECGNKVKGVTI